MFTLKAVRRLLKEIKDNENNGKTFHIRELEDLILLKGFPSGSVAKNLPASTGDVGLIPESGKTPGRGNGNPLEYSYWENPKDGGAW